MNETKTKSIAHERRIDCYPPPKYHILIKGYKEINEMKASEAITEIVKHFFDNMPENKRRLCMNEGIKATSKHHY